MKIRARLATQLDEAFWARFSKTIWEQKSLALKNVNSSLRGLDEKEIFKLLVLYADHCREFKNPEGFKFYIAGEKVYEQETLKFLPLKKDKSLLGYHARMSQRFPDYCLVCDELLRVNLDKQLLITEFTSQLYRHVGFPNRFSEMGLYLGNYRKTPFGVHADGCGVFSFPVLGLKKFRIWTPEYIMKNPNLTHAFEYSKHKKSSLLLTGGPGDMTYWPSSAWHIAESDGSFSATWSLGVWVDRLHQEIIAETMTTLVAKQLGKSAYLPTTPFKSLHRQNGQISTLPDLYLQSISELLNLSAEQVYEAFAKAWLKHISKRGFKNLPKGKAKLGSRIRLRNQLSTILWFESPLESKLYFSFAGSLMESPQSPALLKLIKALNAGQTCTLSPKFKKFMQPLIELGAFV